MKCENLFQHNTQKLLQHGSSYLKFYENLVIKIYMEITGSLVINIAAFPKQAEEKEIISNRKQQN